MPDIVQASHVTNEIKSRFLADLNGTDVNSGQFMDVMMARGGSSDDDLKELVKKMDKAEAQAVRPSKPIKPKEKVERAVEVKADTDIAVEQPKLDPKEQIKAKIKEIIASDQTPIKDARPIEALKDMANFLLQAQDNGQIKLPSELTKKLQDFLAKADDLKAGGLADFMHDFIAAFKDIKIPLTASKSDSELVWPKELHDKLKEINLGGLVPAEQLVNLMQAVKAVKALVNKNENIAIDTLKDKAQDILAEKDLSAVLVPVALTNKVEAKPIVDIVKAAEIPALAALVKPVAVEEKPHLQVKPVAQIVVPELPVKEADVSLLPELELKDLESDVPVCDKGANRGPKLTPVDVKPDATAVLPEKLLDVIKDAKPVQANLSAAIPAPKPAAQIASIAADNVALAPLDVDAGALLNVQNAFGADRPAGSSLAAHAKFAGALSNATQSLNNGNSAVEQVIVQLQARANKAQQISVQLSPAELGQVEVRVEVKRDGQTHAVITADKPETLAMLQKDASQLEKALQQAGLNANSENMSFNLREQRNANQGFSRSKRVMRDVIEGAPKELALNVHGSGSIISDTRVNYHA